jgi:hypothetical protein
MTRSLAESVRAIPVEVLALRLDIVEAISTFALPLPACSFLLPGTHTGVCLPAANISRAAFGWAKAQGLTVKLRSENKFQNVLTADIFWPGLGVLRRASGRSRTKVLARIPTDNHLASNNAPSDSMVIAKRSIENEISRTSFWLWGPFLSQSSGAFLSI